jgi:hypothetical protein
MSFWPLRKHVISKKVTEYLLTHTFQSLACSNDSFFRQAPGSLVSPSSTCSYRYHHPVHVQSNEASSGLNDHDPFSLAVGGWDRLRGYVTQNDAAL